MQATVIKNESGRVSVKGRQSQKVEHLDRLNTDLKVGDLVEVKRVINNPFLVRVK